ncbi:MAG: 4Fe-4S binding protein [Eubacteriales bacterium]|nr:4Fe-4S binding protein [Eubacteriales bacterium]
MGFIPNKLSDLPAGAAFEGGHPTTHTGNWRIFKPVLNKDKCRNCLLCWIFCPEAVIKKGSDNVEITYDFCKGCGICANECPTKAIEMVKEG